MRTLILLVLAAACSGHEPPREASHEHWCTLRLSAKGMYLDGRLTSRPEAIAACQRTSGAVVVLEDSAPHEMWTALEADLHQHGVQIRLRGAVDDNDCFNNPLAKGCQ